MLSEHTVKAVCVRMVMSTQNVTPGLEVATSPQRPALSWQDLSERKLHSVIHSSYSLSPPQESLRYPFVRSLEEFVDEFLLDTPQCEPFSQPTLPPRHHLCKSRGTFPKPYWQNFQEEHLLQASLVKFSATFWGISSNEGQAGTSILTNVLGISGTVMAIFYFK